METFNFRKEIEKSQNYEEELLMIDQFLFHLPKIFMKSDDLAIISSEENYPEENFHDCSDVENDVQGFPFTFPGGGDSREGTGSERRGNGA